LNSRFILENYWQTGHRFDLGNNEIARIIKEKLDMRIEGE
jgi:hypothetical protein